MSKHKYSDYEKTIFSDNLKFYMKLYNVSNQEFSNETSIPYTTLMDWLNKNSYPSPKNIKILEEYFSINFDELQKKRTKEEEVEMENDLLISLVKSTLENENGNFTDEQRKQIIKICKEVLKKDN